LIVIMAAPRVGAAEHTGPAVGLVRATPIRAAGGV